MSITVMSIKICCNASCDSKVFIYFWTYNGTVYIIQFNLF